MRVGNDTVDPTETPKSKGQSGCESTKTIDPKYGEDDSKMLKFYLRGEASRRTLDDGSKDTDQPIEMIDEPEQKISAPKISGQAQRPTMFYQLGLDYINYTDACKPRSYEEPIVASDEEICLQAMKSKMDSID